VSDEAVCVGKAETESIAESQQQAIVIELMHHELRKFQCSATDGERF